MATDNEPHGVDRLIGDLRRWAADARASDAARARSRQRWLRRQAEEESTLAGIALNLAERGTAVVLETTSGHTHRGRLLGLARDVWLLRSGGSSVTFVAADAIAAFQCRSPPLWRRCSATWRPNGRACESLSEGGPTPSPDSSVRWGWMWRP